MAPSLLRASDDAELGCVVSADNQFEDCLPPNHAVLTDVDNGYYFHTDDSGAPGAFQARQHRGRSLFQWTDFSLCEQSFTLTRKWKLEASKPWSSEDTFTAGDMAVHGSSTCGEEVIAVDHFDDLTNSIGIEDEAKLNNKRELGMTHVRFEALHWVLSWRHPVLPGVV